MPAMKVTVLKKDLGKTLSYASRFVSTRAQLPVLSNIKLVASGAKLTIMATNLEMSIAAPIGAQVDDPGEVAVPARTFIDLISSLNSEKIAINSDGENLSFEADNFKGDMVGLNTSDFPAVPMSIEKPMELTKEDFSSALDRVLFSCSLDDTRPALAGVLLIFDSGTLSLVSSDGFRLSKKDISIKDKSQEKIILPKSVLVEVGKISGGIESLSLSFNKDENQVVFSLDDIIVSSRLVDGEYPPFEKIIPESSSLKINVDKTELTSAVKTASVFARDASNIVKLHGEDEALFVSVESPKSGSQESTVVAKVDGPAIDILYNFRYLEDFLSVAAGESVELRFNSPTAAGVFIDSADEGYLHLIMPVKSQ